MNRTLKLACLTLCIFGVIGCYPMELAVSSDGTVVVPRAEGFVVYRGSDDTGYLLKIAGAEEAPAFAAISHDGTLLARAILMKDADGTMKSLSKIVVGPIDGSSAKDVAAVENACFVQISPDNKTVSYAAVAGQGAEGVDEALPELNIFTIADGREARVARNVSVIHRWTPDGRIVFLKTERKKDQTRYGALCSYDPATNKVTRIVSVIDAEWFELSPDGAEAVISAKVVTAAEKALAEAPEDAVKALHVVDMTKGSIKTLTYDAAFCRYSPDGKRVALLRGSHVEVTDRQWGEPATALAKSVASDLENSTKVHLSWLSADEILVLRKKAIFGVNGTTLELVAVNAATGETKLLQGRIEQLAAK